MKRNYTNILLAGGLILMAVIARIVNHELHIYNLAPVAALGLFSGAVLSDKRFSYLFTFMAMFLSDLYIEFFMPMKGFYDVSQFFVYGSMALVTFMGTKMKDRKALRVAGFTIAGSAVFFLLSNFGTFLAGYWGPGIDGLVTTYTMALPFYRSEFATTLFLNTFIGDLVFSGILFGAFAVLQSALDKKPATA